MTSHPLRPGQGQNWPPHPLPIQHAVFFSFWFVLFLFFFFLSPTHPFRHPPVAELPADWWRGEKRGTLACNAFPCFVVVVVWCCPHTLTRLGSYSYRGVCVGLPLIHRSSFIFWEIWGWASNWLQAFFSPMNVMHSILLAFLCAAYRFLRPGPWNTTVELQKDNSLDWRWKIVFSEGGKIKVNRSKDECHSVSLASCQTNSGWCVAM